MKKKLGLALVAALLLCMLCTAVALADRTFVLDSRATEKNGKVTVSWTDTDYNSPYTVRWQLVYNGRTESTRWYNWDTYGIYKQSCTLEGLVPGKTYKITVSDASGNETSRNYTLKSPKTLSDGVIKASKAKLKLTPAYKTSLWGSAKKLKKLNADVIENKLGDYYYGVKWKLSFPMVSKKKTYFVQVVMTAPSGYTEVVNSSSFKTSYSKSSSRTKTTTKATNGISSDAVNGGSFFSDLKGERGWVESGTYTVTIFMNGCKVKSANFKVN